MRKHKQKRNRAASKNHSSSRYRRLRNTLWKTALFAVILTFAVGGIVFDAVFRAPLRGVETVTVPALAGHDESALSDLNNTLFSIEAEYRYDDTPAGTILEQDIPAGQECRVVPNERKKQIHIIVSLGKKYATVRDWRGEDHRLAEQTLRAQGFTVRVVRERNRRVAAGLVIATDPAPSSLPVGTPVTVYVSTGE